VRAGFRGVQVFRQAGQVATMDETETKVIEIVSEQMGVDKSEITRETHFINDLNADSLDTVELVMEFEDEFELSIPDEEAEKIQTVGQAIDYIKANGSKQG
jgi:acyl carrier protein